MWEQKAKGLFTKRVVTLAELSGYDFLISKHGGSFHTNVQTAFEDGKPCFLFYENNPELMIDWGLNPKNWPDDKNQCLQDIIADVMVGGVSGKRRAIHGVLIDCSKTMEGVGKKLDVDWLVQTAQHLQDRVWKLLKIPVYIYMNMDPVNSYKGNPQDIDTLYQFIGLAGGISTVDFASLDISTGYPADSERPVLPYDDGQHWWFWFYRNVVPGMDVLNYQTKAEVYEQCGLYGFTPKTTTPGTGGGTTTNPGTGGGSTTNPGTGGGSTTNPGTGTNPSTPSTGSGTCLGTGVESTNYQARMAIALERIADALDELVDK